MELNRQTAESALKEASESNPGAWIAHSRYVAMACENIALHCEQLSAEKAYLFGLLHDIGRYAGVSSEKHLFGYLFSFHINQCPVNIKKDNLYSIHAHNDFPFLIF